ncbi:MAG: [FeFe] hydrogenase H-cluster maturation GTPase HydF [Lachnospiraceae bacterium]|nr:[FeFe] hydrogenase H-cluster maturation GTPase HydF [Lachnospiraceae bacterium]
MSINDTPSGERLHIGIFGRRNAGKSSLINAITGQDLAIVSDVKGTTTDPVKKAMELLPLGPVVLIDTPGLDDEGLLGQKRMEKAMQALRQTDIVILTIPADAALDGLEKTLLQEAKKRRLPFFVALNKTDLLADKKQIEEKEKEIAQALSIPLDVIVAVSADKNEGIHALKEKLANGIPKEQERPLIRDLLSPGDLVVLVVPIDSAAPKGRLILPQQQVIRDSLEAGAVPVVTRDSELAQALSSLGKKPRLIVTDSQVFGAVAKIVPKDIPLTSFSILMARYKGDLEVQIAGAKAIETLQDGDMVLISEGCTHHRQCDDIGTVKMPRWIKEYTGKDLQFAFTSGGEFPKDLSPYAMVVHCGGCTLPLQEMRYRISYGAKQEVAITNYGVMIAYIHGILPRVTEIFVDKK